MGSMAMDIATKNPVAKHILNPLVVILIVLVIVSMSNVYIFWFLLSPYPMLFVLQV